MNKTEIIADITERTGLPKKACDAFMSAFIDTVLDSLASGERVVITNLGSFEVIERATREGRNPQTGETMTIAAHKVPKFKPSSTMKNVVK